MIQDSAGSEMASGDNLEHYVLIKNPALFW